MINYDICGAKLLADWPGGIKNPHIVAVPDSSEYVRAPRCEKFTDGMRKEDYPKAAG